MYSATDNLDLLTFGALFSPQKINKEETEKRNKLFLTE
jgi:hypothetical protein